MSTPSNREETLFEQALGLASTEAREAYLREACGADDAMLTRLHGLLGAHDRAGKFLEHKEPDAGARPSPAAAAFDRGRNEEFDLAPPSEPDWRFARIRLSGQWSHRELAAWARAKAKEISPSSTK